MAGSRTTDSLGGFRGRIYFEVRDAVSGQSVTAGMFDNTNESERQGFSDRVQEWLTDGKSITVVDEMKVPGRKFVDDD